MSHALLSAFGLVFVIEGLLYALVPGHLKEMMKSVQTVSDESLRGAGMVAVAFGVLLVWLTRAYLGG
jgi:uncharacterized protein